MKNIHVLPTDRPSRLVKSKDKKRFYLYSIGEFRDIDKFIEYDSKDWYSQNIYITSDAEITEGDYYIKLQNRQYVNRSGKTKFKVLYKDCKKIILTTDRDLIRDGVQAIDGEFLEWFVKNPSCESVEVQDISMQYHEEGYYEYKIIIPKEDWLLNNPQCKQIESCSKSLSKKCICPKEEPTIEEEYLKDELKKYDGIDVVVLNKPEEPKQDLEREMFELEQELNIPSHLRLHNSKPKQETLEEAFEKWAEQQFQKGVGYDKFDVLQFGAKWQQEQFGKSEFIQKLRGTLSDAEARRLIFEQFKKK